MNAVAGFKVAICTRKVGSGLEVKEFNVIALCLQFCNYTGNQGIESRVGVSLFNVGRHTCCGVNHGSAVNGDVGSKLEYAEDKILINLVDVININLLIIVVVTEHYERNIGCA